MIFQKDNTQSFTDWGAERGWERAPSRWFYPSRSGIKTGRGREETAGGRLIKKSAMTPFVLPRAAFTHEQIAQFYGKEEMIGTTAGTGDQEQ